MINLYVIGNEKIYSNKKNFYCPNIDFKTIVEGLNKYFKVILIARFCSQKQIFKINHNKIFVSPNIISYIRCVVLSFKNLKSNKYLIISITPYTFCAFLILQFFSNKIYLYLRSDGHKEYERILGKQWAFLYSFMYFFFLKKAKIISCGKELVQNKKFFLVNPSELDEYWFKNQKNIFYEKKIKLLYVGRIRIEKGIFNFLNLFKKLDDRFQLTIIGDRYHGHFNIKNILFKNFFSNVKHLIKQYDKHHILILPSYTESHPKVVYEALSRLRPVLIFDDIKHIIRDMNGIFVSKRNLKDFLKTIDQIFKKYKFIKKVILKNNFPKKNTFILQLYKILR